MSGVAVPTSVFIIVIAIAHRALPRPTRRIGHQRPIHAGAPTTSLLRTRRPLVAGTCCTVFVALTVGTTAALIVAVALMLRPHLVGRRNQRRRAAAVDLAFPDFVDMLVLAIRSGCTPVQAIRTLCGSAPSALRDTVAAVDRRVGDGYRFADAITVLPLELGPIAQPLSDSLALADRHGTPLAPILDRLADEARAHRRRAAEVSARQLPIRLSFPLVGCTLPSFVLLTIVPLMAGTLSSLPGFDR